MTEPIIRIYQRLSDLIITMISFVLAHQAIFYLYGSTFELGRWEVSFKVFDPLKEYLGIIVLIPFVWWFVLNRIDIYDPVIIRSRGRLILNLIKANVIGGLVLFGLFFLFRLDFPGRAHMIFFILISTVSQYFFKRVFISSLTQSERRERFYHHILLIGTGPEARRFARHINSYPELGYKVIGFISESEAEIEETYYNIKVLGSIKNIENIIKSVTTDEVIFLSPSHMWEKVDQIGLICEDMGIRLTFAPDLFNLRISRTYFRKLVGTPLISFITTPIGEWEALFKRAFDVAVSLIVLLILSPLLIIIPIAIKIDSQGPVFFKQKRVGLNGRIFNLIKFRSMVKDAEAIQDQLWTLNEMTGPVFKMAKDPRITRVGNWLRKSSFDEITQLINVLKGDMSLVGPRPPIPSEVEKYERWQRRRLSVKPGITCIWQVSGRNEISFDEWIKLDLEYIDHWSFTLDLKVLIRTIPAVLFAKGAK
jgi:exopolysaccharide biosynthesis polyprenyl glycosylphosphotransferase